MLMPFEGLRKHIDVYSNELGYNAPEYIELNGVVGSIRDNNNIMSGGVTIQHI